MYSQQLKAGQHAAQIQLQSLSLSTHICSMSAESQHCVTHFMTSSALALNGKPFILTMPSPPNRRASAACISLRGTCRLMPVEATCHNIWQGKCTEPASAHCLAHEVNIRQGNKLAALQFLLDWLVIAGLQIFCKAACTRAGCSCRGGDSPEQA